MPLPCGQDGILLAGYREAYFVPGLPESTGQIQQTQWLVINLLLDEKYTHV
jgi:hypothetical protein